ncbi:MAG: M48 family metalloprotease, partial [Alphaproteobacteria bacterium]|nr:M48 family metalloprotease [Alphaproteobacteria bacterium]
MSWDNDMLDQADIEALRLYDPHSLLHQEISAKIKQIFERLFQNTDINVDDFYFTGYDSGDANAFFIDASETKNGKNIVAISYGLIQSVSNTEELAAIIGHECGHYLWSQLLGGENTIFQERAADLRSVDLMINAGYNPRNVLSAEQKVFGELKYTSATLDVHGNSFNRVEDVKTYLAKLTLERGSFPDVAPSDPEYDKFKEKIKNIRVQQPYLSYIDKNLMSFLKSTNIKKITRTPQFRDALLIYLRKDIENISKNKTRLGQLEFIYKNFDFVANPPTDIETFNLRDIFNRLMELSNENDIIEPFLPSILSHSRLDAFNGFKKLFDAVSSFYKAASSSFYDTAYVSP